MVRIEQEDEDDPEGVDVAVEQDCRPQSEMVQAQEGVLGSTYYWAEDFLFKYMNHK